MGDASVTGRPSGFGVMIPILLGAVLAVVAGSLYMFYQLNLVRDEMDEVRSELAETRNQLLACAQFAAQRGFGLFQLGFATGTDC